MKDILDLYEESYDPVRPVVYFDESPKQLIAEVRKPGDGFYRGAQLERNEEFTFYLSRNFTMLTLQH